MRRRPEHIEGDSEIASPASSAGEGAPRARDEGGDMKAFDRFSVIAFAAGVGLALGASSEARAATISADGTTCTLNDAITTANLDRNTGGCVRVGAGTADTIELTGDITFTTADPTP